MNKTEALKKIKQLVNYYNQNIETWESNANKEAEARKEFIDGFFETLGWKISGLPVSMSADDRDVLVEYSLKVEGETTKSLDYIFKIKNRHQFVVEAKKPSESLDNPKHVFQAKSYGFLSKIPFVILTNFKEIRIYDISTKPNINQINEDLIFSCTHNEYGENFNYIWDNFSKDAVLEKSLVKLYTNRRNDLNIDLDATDYSYILKKGELLLDTTFLQDLERIRLNIAANILLETSEELNEKEINEATQRLLDIIIFIRFLEDNEIEDIERLRVLINNSEENFINSLKNLCSELNIKFNGLLFHEYPLFDKISINKDVIKDNILKLYYPESPYNFSMISIEILGRIFEQYLAKRITVTDGNVSLEVKPEIKKAGGIYYTPEYIVDQILNDTLEVFLSDKSPNEVFDISKIIDFSCGSGIFLIKAYKRLIQFYERNSSSLSPELLFTSSLGSLNLTMESKKNLLQQNIFGIDIDSQAIEIAKMSLYFTMLENYNEDNSPRPLLPSLEKNLICGNSVVDLSFFEKYPEASIDSINIINPFSWVEEGLNKFDVIVGNPPYLRIQLLEELYPIEYQLFLKDKYEFAYSNFDLSILFVEKAISVLSSTGKIGYIIPNTVLRAKYGEKFREIISNNKLLSKIIYFDDFQVFGNSTSYTCLFYLDAEQTDLKEFKYLNLEDPENDFQDKKLIPSVFNKEDLGSSPWYFAAFEVHEKFIENITRNTFPIKNLSNLKKVFVGLQPSVNDVFLFEIVEENERFITCYSKALHSNHTFEKGLIKKLVKGSKNIFRYKINSNKALLFPYLNTLETNKSDLISEEVLKLSFPETWKYLKKCETILNEKDALKGNDFYKFIYKKNHLLFDHKKLLFPSLCYGSRFSLDVNGEFYFTGSGEGGGGGYGLILNDDESDYNYYNILGIINSKVISALIELKGSPKSGGYKGIDLTFIHSIPLPILNTQRKTQIAEEIASKTERLNNIYAEVQSLAIKRLVSQLENQIDILTFELYEITDADIVKLINELND
jgi:hypothetical protein